MATLSYGQIRGLKITPNIPRSFHFEHEDNADFAIDLVQEHSVCGLDWAVFNRNAAAAITVAVDGGTAITIPAGGSRGYNNVKFAFLKIVAAVNYTLMLAGVSV